MAETFRDLPEALDNTNLIVDKVETTEAEEGHPPAQLPATGRIHQPGRIPAAPHLRRCDQALHQRWGLGHRFAGPEDQGALDFELFVIRTMGFAGYFLIVRRTSSTTVARSAY
jgi:DNA polymerase-3 subunit alpha